MSLFYPHKNIYFLMIAYFLIVVGNKAHAQVQANWSADNVNGTFSNPLLYGDWPDPDVIRVGDDFYFVSTSMHFVPGSPIAHSKDLVNWEMAGYAVDRYNEDPKYNMQGGTMYTKGSWANCIRYRDGIFYVGFCTPNGDESGHFSMCTATNVKGPWKRIIFPEYMYDPGILFDDDGKVYVAHGQGTLYVTELNKDALSVKTPKQKIYYNPKHPYLEGSHIYKINGMYYLMNSSSGVQMVCLRSKNIYGPYEEKIVLKDTTKTPFTTYPPHQGGMVQLKDGSWWFIIMQDYGSIGRTPNLMPVYWKDGWPMLGVDGKIPMTFAKPNVGKQYKPMTPATSDEFNDTTLGLQWQWNHNPDNSRYSLGERQGYLRLKACAKASELSVARNTLTQRIQGPNSTITTLLDIRGLKPGDVAGLTVFQAPYAYIGIQQNENERRLIMYNHDKVIDSKLFSGDSVYLKAKASETGTAVFLYSIDGKKFQSFGDTLHMDLGYPWTANRFGLFNFSTTDEGTQGYADFNWFRYSTDFVALSTEVRIGEKVQFRAGTISDKKISYQWIFEGGIPRRSNQPNPTVLYKKEGKYSVSLTCQSGKQKETLNRKLYITVHHRHI